MRDLLREELPLALPVLLLLALVPFVATESYIRHLFIIAMVYAIVASNWDLSLGYGGIFNFAHLSFFGVGAYTSAILSKTLEITPWLSVPASAFTAMAAAALVCLPVLRLQGIYIILVTFAFAQLVLQLILSQSDITGGSRGMVLLPPLEIGDINFARDGKFGYYFVALGLLAVSTLTMRWLVRSAFGRGVIAMRDDPDYAAARGLSVARQRLMTMILSAAFTGVAGGFYATYLRVASTKVFEFGILSLVLSMLLVGGINTVYGPIVAAFALTFLTEFMVDLGPWRFLIIAALMVLVLLVYPGGLWSIFTSLAPKRKSRRR
ncbi:MAG: branched-chain amino acid ABC transporter permease [Alphaproteobacteria bacterium]